VDTIKHAGMRKPVTVEYKTDIRLTVGSTSKVTLPTMVQCGWGVDGPSWVFVVLQYFEMILPLVDSLPCALQDEVYIMSCDAAGDLWRHPRWPPSWPPSWISLKMETNQNGGNRKFLMPLYF